MKKYNNKSIRYKLVFTFAVTVTLLVVVTTIMQFAMGDIGEAYEHTYRTYGIGSERIATVDAQFYRIIGEVEYCLLMPQKEIVDAKVVAIKDATDTMATELQELGKLLVGTEAENIFAKTSATLEEFFGYSRAMIQDLEQFDVAAAGALLADAKVEACREAVVQILDEAIDLLDVLGEEHLAESAGGQLAAQIFSLVVTTAAGVITIVWAFYLVRNIRKPIEDLTEVAKKLATGDVEVEVVKHFEDEIGTLADCMKHMIANIKYQAEVIKEASVGNLTVDVNPASAHDVAGNALKVLVTENNNVLLNIRDAVNEVTSGSEQIASASQSLAQGSTEQASAIEEITASIDEITQKIRVNAADASEASNLVSQAKEDAVVGNERMGEMIGAMNDINQSSENISKIIKVIDDIAFQTNILALNAAVEAARAGQHGKGFAVVAEEVRNLAGKSAQAASETAELIEDSIDKVGKGSKLAEETAGALEGIVEMIEKIVTLTSSIATASGDQATAIAQIDQALGQVSQVVQTNSATSEQCAAASEELSAQSEKLKDMVSNYRLKEYRRGSDGNRYSYDRKDEYKLDISEKDEYGDKEPVISLEDGFGKY